MSTITLGLWPTDHKWDDDIYLMQHLWSSDSVPIPGPPVIRESDGDILNVVFNYTLGTQPTGNPSLDLSGNSPVGLHTGLTGTPVTGALQFVYGGSGPTWTPSEGEFLFNALIHATVSGDARIYKADPTMIVKPG